MSAGFMARQGHQYQQTGKDSGQTLELRTNMKTDYLTDFRINQTSDRDMNSEKILRQQILKTNQKLKTLKGHLYSGQTLELRTNMKTDYLTEFRINETSDRHMNSEKILRQQI